MLVVLNEAGEASIPLEVAANMDASDISLEVCAFFEPDEETFGVDVHSLDASSQLDPRPYVRLLQLIQERDPDLVHVHPNATGSIVRVLVKILGIPLLSTQHHPHEDFGLAKNVVNGSTNWLNDVIVCPSNVTAASFHDLESALIRLSGTEKLVIPNGVDLAEIRRAREVTPPDLPDGPLVGTASRLVPHKQVHELLRAARRLEDSDVDAKFVVVGDGPERERLEGLAERLEIRDRVLFTGFLPTRAEVHAVMDRLDVFAFPTCSEGFGVAVAEAMALGTTVVVNDIPILHEVVGDAGVFVDATDTDEFANALQSLLEDEPRRVELGAEGATRIEEQFSLEHTTTEYVDLYRRMTAEQ
ncbi:glycosyltransferase family 4 protein [Halorientalis halophila]|uniref:glycosyltransferase family 4 protein n=1 Tax=Halorientalis halophila TaxID=3108499 RepID=UPI00300B1614